MRRFLRAVPARTLSVLAGPWARTLLVLLGGAYFAWQEKRRAAGVFVGAIAGAGVLNSLVKKLVSRPRPAGSDADGKSFPSGHTTGTLVMTLGGSYLLWRATNERLLAIALAGLGTPLTGLVGLSRVVLREHHPGDVAGSYLVGGLWLALLLRVVPRLLNDGSDDGPPHR